MTTADGVETPDPGDGTGGTAAAPSLWRNRGFRRLPAVVDADPAASDVTVPAGGDDGA